MCIAPGLLNDGQLVGCRKCWQCKERRVNDWAGRCIAESKTALACNFVTLTYGREGNDQVYGAVDHERAAVLTYSDVQKFFKRLRTGHKRVKYPCRYFVVGEYGSLKGRSHWHALIYWTSKNIPKFTLDVREPSPFWDHGCVQWERLTHISVRYACKYLQKDIGEMERQGHMSMSKKPPLGTEYFRGMAQQYVEQELAPQKLNYGWRDVTNKQGKEIDFYMSATVARDFVQAFVDLWAEKHGKRHAPWSELVETYQDRKTRKELNDDWLGRWDDPSMVNLQDRQLRSKRNEVGFSTAWKEADGQPLIWQWDQEGNGKWTSMKKDDATSGGKSARSAERRKPLSDQQRHLNLYGQASRGE